MTLATALEFDAVNAVDRATIGAFRGLPALAAICGLVPLHIRRARHDLGSMIPVYSNALLMFVCASLGRWKDRGGKDGRTEVEGTTEDRILILREVKLQVW